MNEKKGRPKILPEDMFNMSIRLERPLYHKLRERSLEESKLFSRHVGMAEIVRSALLHYLNPGDGEKND